MTGNATNWTKWNWVELKDWKRVQMEEAKQHSWINWRLMNEFVGVASSIKRRPKQLTLRGKLHQLSLSFVGPLKRRQKERNELMDGLAPLPCSSSFQWNIFIWKERERCGESKQHKSNQPTHSLKRMLVDWFGLLSFHSSIPAPQQRENNFLFVSFKRKRESERRWNEIWLICLVSGGRPSQSKSTNEWNEAWGRGAKRAAKGLCRNEKLVLNEGSSPARAGSTPNTLHFITPALLFLPQRKDFSFAEWNELRERKTINLSFLCWWAPQPIKEKEIGFSFFKLNCWPAPKDKFRKKNQTHSTPFS